MTMPDKKNPVVSEIQEKEIDFSYAIPTLDSENLRGRFLPLDSAKETTRIALEKLIKDEPTQPA